MSKEIEVVETEHAYHIKYGLSEVLQRKITVGTFRALTPLEEVLTAFCKQQLNEKNHE